MQCTRENTRALVRTWAFPVLAVCSTFVGPVFAQAAAKVDRPGVKVCDRLRMFLNYRVRRLGAGGEQVAHLAEQVDTLRGDLADTRADLAEVHERLDFAERLLTQARDEGRLPPRA